MQFVTGRFCLSGADDRFSSSAISGGRVEKPVGVMPDFPPEVAHLLRDTGAFEVP